MKIFKRGALIFLSIAFLPSCTYLYDGAGYGLTDYMFSSGSSGDIAPSSSSSNDDSGSGYYYGSGYTHPMDNIYQKGTAILYGEEGYTQNIAQGMSMIAQAADGGHQVAQLHLGTLYAEGELVASDEAKAKHYLKLASEGKNLYLRKPAKHLLMFLES